MKLRKTGFTLALFLLLSSLAGQICLPDGITFSNQQQIDAFPANYPDCIVIGGPVIISEEMDGNITNLQGLSQITEIEGDLSIIHNNSLHNLGGLEQLETIGGSLNIQLNDSLTMLQGLATLETIETTFSITHNAMLTNLHGLAFLKTIGRNFIIQFKTVIIVGMLN